MQFAFSKIVLKWLCENEKQRYGRNKQTSINHTYVNSGAYRKKFDKISDNVFLNRLLFKLAKKMLQHRSGTLYEDMYWIDLDTMEIVAEETGANVEEEIVYSDRTKKVIAMNNRLLTIHSHPNSFPPSVSDFKSNFCNHYLVGIIVCHDGTLYMYSASEDISKEYYNLSVAEYVKRGYNECDAQKHTLEDMKERFAIKFKEVTDNDV